MRHTNDLGKDPIFPLVLRLAIPTMLAQFVSVLYSIVDRMYIGAGVGSLALAGVGVCAPIVTLLSSFASLIGLGGSPIMAMRMGAGDEREAQKILNNSFFMLLVTSVLLTFGFLALKEKFLMWFGASQATFPYANTYVTIYTMGTVFALLSTGMNSFLIAQGFSGLGMVTVMLGAVLNIVLDPVFIFGFHMGVAGAAVATVISQLASAVFVLVSLRGKKNAHKTWLGRLCQTDDAENHKLRIFSVFDYRQRQYPADCAEYGAAALRRSGRGRYSGYLRHHRAELSIVDYYAHEWHYPGQSAGGQL